MGSMNIFNECIHTRQNGVLKWDNPHSKFAQTDI